VNLVVWVMMGIAVWHFAVFVPDRFWGGIVGAFGAAALGAVVVGLALAGGDISDTSIVTALEAVPGALIGLAASWFYGARREAAHA
jgi:outer membrane lipoprotein SlyB